MLIYTLFVMIVFFSIEGIQRENKGIRRLSQFLILVIFYLVAGISYRIHNDYFVYEYMYKKINFLNLKYIDFEKGYVVLNAIFNSSLDFYNFKSLIYLINTFLIYKGLKNILKGKRVYIVLGLMYLLFNQFYYFYSSAFRQSVAIAIFIYSLSYIRDRKLIKYTLSIILAFFFHKSAVILYLVYFIFNSKIKVRMGLNIFLYLIFNGLILIPQVPQKIVFIFYKVVSILRLGELNEVYLFREINIGIKNIIFNLFLIILYKYLTKKENYFLNKMLFCYIIIEILSKTIGIFYRVEIYFTVFYCIFLLELFLKCNENIILKLLKIGVVLFIGINYNIRGIWDIYIKDGSLIPLHFTFERLYKNINYKETAEYKHLLNRYENNTELNYIEESIRRSYIKE